MTGQALEINGGTTGSDYIDRYYPFSGISSDPTMSWDANSAAGAAYGVRITSASYYEVWSYLDTTGHYQMVDWNTGYPVDCGAVSTGTWVTMELAFDYTALTADLSVDGTPTSCVGMMLGGGSPIATIEFIDWSDSGYGGITDIDNIVAVDGGSPAWTIDFESYSLGELPAPWASYFESGSSTMLVIAL